MGRHFTGGLVDSRKIRTLRASPEQLRAFGYLRAFKHIMLIRTSIGDCIDPISAASASWLARKVAPSGLYAFSGEHRFVIRRTMKWESGIEAVMQDLRACGVDFDYRDIVDGMQNAEKNEFSATTMAKLCGYTTAIQKECDKRGIKIPFSPSDSDPLYKKLRALSLRRKRDSRRREEAGMAPHSKSIERNQPWKALGMGRTKYFEMKKKGAFLDKSPRAD